jgi:hypothetical protein
LPSQLAPDKALQESFKAALPVLERVSSTSKERAQCDVPPSMDTACVLTVAVDNAKRIVTQAAGKFNMNLNQRARPDK